MRRAPQNGLNRFNLTLHRRSARVTTKRVPLLVAATRNNRADEIDPQPNSGTLRGPIDQRISGPAFEICADGAYCKDVWDNVAQPGGIEPECGVARHMTGSLGLVLSGGFLRGAFQVGVIEALHAHGIRFDVVAGVSSGAWNAACIATGQVHEMREFWLSVARSPKLRWRNLWRHGTPSNFPEIVQNVPMRRLRFQELDDSGVRLRIGATSIGDRRLRWFESWTDTKAFFDTLMASNYIPGLYGRPIRIGGRYYVDGGVVDNVPYEASLEAGCDRVLVIVPDARGRIWKRPTDRTPHEIPDELRSRVVVIHPDSPLSIGRVRSTPEDVLDCISAGHRAAEKALADSCEAESFAPPSAPLLHSTPR